MQNISTYNYILTFFVILSFIVSFLALNDSRSNISIVGQESLAESVLTDGEINVGYIVYDPFIIINPENGELSGISYDLAEMIADRLQIKINWSGMTTWGTATEDLKIGRYDMIGVLMWPNSARARNAYFSDPAMYSLVHAYVRSDDERFSEGLDILNSGEYTISTLDGEMSSFIARESYPESKTLELPELSSVSEVLLNVVSGKADIAFVDPSTANNFLQSNPGTIKKASNELVRTFGNSYVFPRGEDEMLRMWNITLQELANEGKVELLLKKYNVQDEFLLEGKVFK